MNPTSIVFCPEYSSWVHQSLGYGSAEGSLASSSSLVTVSASIPRVELFPNQYGSAS